MVWLQRIMYRVCSVTLTTELWTYPPSWLQICNYNGFIVLVNYSYIPLSEADNLWTYDGFPTINEPVLYVSTVPILSIIIEAHSFSNFIMITEAEQPSRFSSSRAIFHISVIIASKRATGNSQEYLTPHRSGSTVLFSQPRTPTNINDNEHGLPGFT